MLHARSERGRPRAGRGVEVEILRRWQMAELPTDQLWKVDVVALQRENGSVSSGHVDSHRPFEELRVSSLASSSSYEPPARIRQGFWAAAPVSGVKW